MHKELTKHALTTSSGGDATGVAPAINIIQVYIGLLTHHHDNLTWLPTPTGNVNSLSYQSRNYQSKLKKIMPRCGNTFHITGPLWGESTSHWWIPLQRTSNVVFDVFCDVSLKTLLNKQLRYQTPCSLCEVTFKDEKNISRLLDWTVMLLTCQ